MAYFPNGIQLTEQGKNLNIKVLANNISLNIEAIAIGDGQDVNRPINQLKNELFRASSVSTRILSPTLMSFDLDFSEFAATQTIPWIFREAGIFANDPDDGVILYAYGNCGEHFDTIPPSSSATYVRRILQILTTVADAANVVINIDSSYPRIVAGNGIAVTENAGVITISLA